MNRATYGADAFMGEDGELPNPFPRTVGPRAMEYLQEVVDSGLERRAAFDPRTGTFRGYDGRNHFCR